MELNIVTANQPVHCIHCGVLLSYAANPHFNTIASQGNRYISLHNVV